MLWSPKFRRGKGHDHRKAERGQNTYGGGGDQGPSRDGQQVEVADIESRLTRFRRRKRAKKNNPH